MIKRRDFLDSDNDRIYEVSILSSSCNLCEKKENWKYLSPSNIKHNNNYNKQYYDNNGQSNIYCFSLYFKHEKPKYFPKKKNRKFIHSCIDHDDLCRHCEYYAIDKQHDKLCNYCYYCCICHYQQAIIGDFCNNCYNVNFKNAFVSFKKIDII